MRKTKLVCTLGPASTDESVIRELIESGMNVARLNFSHGTYENFKLLISRVKKLRRELKTPVAILLDTKGPEIRLGTVDGTIELEKGQSFTLTNREITATQSEATLSYKGLWKCVKPGDRILIDDGLVELRTENVAEGEIRCTVIVGGPIKNHKGINVPYVKTDIPFLSDKDREDLLFGIREDIDFVAASFVRRAEDVRELRDFLADNGGKDIRIISKIENAEGVENFDEILSESDGIMVARGDMGVEIEFQKLPGLQKTFIRKTYEAGKMSITATQMLESMIENSTPTRAEITDVANAVFDGTSAIMLSGETAMGAHPALVVRTMSNIALQAEKDSVDMYGHLTRSYCVDRSDPLTAICDAAVTLAKDLNASAIVAQSTSGTTARGVSSFRPMQPIIAPTPKMKTYYQLALSWGVYPMLTFIQSETDEFIRNAVECAKESGLVKEGDIAVITAGIPLNESPVTNMLKIQEIK